MCAVILLFAFIMSLVINYAEKLITRHQQHFTSEPETDEVLATEKSE